MNEQLRFDFKEGQRRKGAAISRLQRHPLLETFREIAVELLKTRSSISADDVQREAMRRGYAETEIGNAMGAVFKDKRFEFTGEYVASQRIRANGNLLRCWRLR